MWHTNDGKREKVNNRKSRTTQSRKNQNVRRKGELQLLGNNGNGHHQKSGDERIY